jgi:nitrite reductase/ring-hydroxylating ferredoxin subunit
MSADQSKPSGPDLAQGIDANQLRDGVMLVGHIGDQAVLLAKSGSEIFAVGATCTHYGGPLGDGLLVGDTVRCPWHHACFSLRTGDAIRAPALSEIPCFAVETRDGKLFVHEARKGAARAVTQSPAAPPSVVIVGGGAAAQRRRYAGKDTAGRSRCSVPTPIRRTTGPIYRRIIWRGLLRMTGYRYEMPPSINSMPSICALGPVSLPSTRSRASSAPTMAAPCPMGRCW